MITSVKKAFTRNVMNAFGPRTSNKIVVIESDDWGSVRMPSLSVYQNLLQNGIDVSSNPFNRYDSLECDDDLSALFDVLQKFKDKNGNPPVITANTIMANPDFDKIKASGFQSYYYELFTDTYKKYPACKNTLGLIREGIKNKFYYPQLHGREHLNVNQWMKALQSDNKKFRTSFDLETFGIDERSAGSSRSNYMAAFDFETPDELNSLNEVIHEGNQLFSQVFGFNSTSFIAPCNVWHPDLEGTLNESGIKYLQGLIVQFSPSNNGSKYRRIYHYQGQKNNYGQRYFVRNCFFELSTIAGYDWIGECIKRINTAFRWNKPAIISMHRLNFIGSINENNRTQNLLKLSELLSIITKKWPDVIFASTNTLETYILN